MKKIKDIIIYIGSCMFLMTCKINNVLAARTTMPGNSDLGCDGIFGDPNEPDTVANLIKEVLWVFRIVAPVLVILLGSVDLFLAMSSSSEDKMKKAQSNFVKRVIMGVCLFFVPSIINFILDIASRSLGYDACMFKW